jgi:hypothetical protein
VVDQIASRWTAVYCHPRPQADSQSHEQRRTQHL